MPVVDRPMPRHEPWLPARDHKMRLVFLVGGCGHLILDAVRPDGPRSCPQCEQEPCPNAPGNPPRRWYLLHRAADVVEVQLPPDRSAEHTKGER